MKTVSLSDKHFSKSEFPLLNKNLNFCPRPNKYNKQNLNKDLLKFYRNIKFRAHFGSTQNNLNETRLKSNSNWLPDKLTSCVETFITVINHDLKTSKTKKLPRGHPRNMNVKHFLIYIKEMTSLPQKLTKGALW